MGEAALDMITAWHYDYKLDNPLNREFVKEFNAMHGRNPDFFSIGGYDGMHVIYEALKKTGGNTDGEALIARRQGDEVDSPRGPMSIDPETRDVVQTIYIRRVQKVGDEYVNVPFDRIEKRKRPRPGNAEEIEDARLARRRALRRVRLRDAVVPALGRPFR